MVLPDGEADLERAALDGPDLNFIVYHSGFRGTGWLGRGTGAEMALGRWHGMQVRTRSFLARGGLDERRAFGAAAEATLTLERITLGPKVEKAEEMAAMFYYSYDALKDKPKILISHLPFK